MNIRQLIRWIIVLAALSAAGVVLIVVGVRASDMELGTALPLVGTALFSSGLTFFLVKIVDSVPQSKN